MKTLANCSPKEFLVQTNKIRRSVEKWLTLTKVLEIRRRAPAFTDDMDDVQKQNAAREQARANISAMLDAVLEDYPEETAELLGLVCFIDPKDLENHKMTEFLSAVSELLNCEEVLDFFISLMRLENRLTSGAARA